MVTETGKNLSVLIITETGKDWQTFSTWYSFYKNLPESKIAIYSLRNGETPFVYYTWAKRLKVPCLKRNPLTADNQSANWLNAILESSAENVIGPQNVLVVQPLVTALDIFNTDLLNKLNSVETWLDEHVWFLKNANVSDMLTQLYFTGEPLKLSDDKLCYQAKETNQLQSLVTYNKGCGKWIDTSKGCPFSCAAGLATSDMSVCENCIIDMWKRMVTIYQATI